MIHSGQPANDFIDFATRHVLLRQGVLGIKVKIMRGQDPEGKAGPNQTLPDAVTIIEPKEEQSVVQPMSQDYGAKVSRTTSNEWINAWEETLMKYDRHSKHSRRLSRRDCRSRVSSRRVSLRAMLDTSDALGPERDARVND